MGRTPSYCFTAPGAEDSQDGLEGEARHGLRGLRATFGILITSTLGCSLVPLTNDLGRCFGTRTPPNNLFQALTTGIPMSLFSGGKGHSTRDGRAEVRLEEA